MNDNRLLRAFADLRQAGKKTLVPFLTAGYPDLETTEALLHDLAGRGVRVCELGIPYSDPVADGPVIQASYTDALARGIHSEQIFQAVRRFRAAGGGPAMALVAMVSYAIIFRHTPAQYLRDAAGAGFDGLIVPDLPLEETVQFEGLADAEGLCNILLIAPTTPPARRLEIARHSRGFLYYISVAGITGQRATLPEATIRGVADLRKHTDTPVCVGFGIANAATVSAVCAAADGAIVGSAIVARLTEARRQPLEQRVAAVGRFVGELLEPLR